MIARINSQTSLFAAVQFEAVFHTPSMKKVVGTFKSQQSAEHFIELEQVKACRKLLQKWYEVLCEPYEQGLFEMYALKDLETRIKAKYNLKEALRLFLAQCRGQKYYSAYYFMKLVQLHDIDSLIFDSMPRKENTKLVLQLNELVVLVEKIYQKYYVIEKSINDEILSNRLDL